MKAVSGELYAAHVRDLERRYADALVSAGLDAIVIHSGSRVRRTLFDTQYWPLRATPHFQHWLPLEQPDCAVVIAAGRRARLLWPESHDIWEAPREPDNDHFLRALDVERPASVAAMRDLMPSGRVGFVGEDTARAAAWGVDDARVNAPELVGALDRLRTVKTPYEVECIAEANRRAADGHRALRDAFLASDSTEFDLHLTFLRVTRQDDFETPYKNIVAFGKNAATLHHVDYGKRQSSRAVESLLVDAGATCAGYCSDITRTWTKGGDPTLSIFAQLVAEVEAMQQRLCGAVRVGDRYEKLHEDAHRQIGDILKRVGISKVTAEEAVEKSITHAFFPHGLGHSLGLQCHDVGCALIKPKDKNPFLRNTSTITTAQVFTVEPGVYFIPDLLRPLREGPHAQHVDFKLVDALTPLGGVRIEDDLLVLTADGPAPIRNLTREVI